MKRSRFSKLIIPIVVSCIIASLVLLACAAPATTPSAGESATTTAPEKVYKARLTTHWPPTHQADVMAEKFIQACESESNGRLKIEHYSSGQLYGVYDALGALSQGSVEFAGLLDTILPTVDPNLTATQIYYAFDSFYQVRQVWNSEAGQKIIKANEAKLGIMLLAHDPVGPSYGFSTNKKIACIEDCAGLKARTLGVFDRLANEALGMKSVNVQTGEVYTALQQGMIDYICTPSSAMKSNSWWDFLKYVSLPAVVLSDAYIGVNTKWLKSLPEDLQDIIVNKVSPKIEEEAIKTIMEQSLADIKAFEQHGGTVTTISPEELQRFKTLMNEKVTPVVASKVDPALWAEVQKVTGLK